MLIIESDAASSAGPALPNASIVTSRELALLAYVQLTAAAERHLLSIGAECPDHQVCRRLAFARFLHLRGRLTEQVDSTTIG